MKVSIYNDKCKIRHIAISGEIQSSEEVAEILSNLDDEHERRLSITFFDANMLHKDIVERLHCLETIKDINIYVFKMCLYSYLHKMSIKSEYVLRKSLEVSPYKKASEDTISIESLTLFLQELYDRYGYDYRNYELGSIMRRIKVCMLKENISSFKEFYHTVLQEPLLFEHLFQEFSINTTEFFRNPEVFQAVRNKVLPQLDSYKYIKIWCAGCSSGREAYSLAIMLDELGMLHKTQIYATDINPYIIEEAKNGLYPSEAIRQEILNYEVAGGTKNFMSYFVLNGDYIEVKSYLSKNILFFQHSLTEKGSLNEFQMILCRNVMIYFNNELQSSVLKRFYHSLNRNGFLIIGKSESMLLNSGDKYFKPYMHKEKVYKVK